MIGKWKDVVKDVVGVRLQADHFRLTKELKKKMGEAVASLSGTSVGYDEEAGWEMADLDRVVGSVNHIRGQIAEVEHALAKLDEGTYGLCDSCGGAISSARLEAIPQASLCIDCRSIPAKRIMVSRVR